jgi:hypothetical protein
MAMLSTETWSKAVAACAAAAIVAMSAGEARPAEPGKPVAGKLVRFSGSWSGLPQIGSEGKVRLCVLAAKRSRSRRGGAIETDLSISIGRGAGFAISILDAEVPPEQILDDQAEILLDGSRSIPAAGFTAGPNSFALHPGDAAGVLLALEKAVMLTLRSDGAGIDSTVTLSLPREVLGWLKRCGEAFDIAIDRPTDPAAPALPAPRPRSPKVSPARPTAAGPAGIEDKQKISGWDASELRGGDGTVAACMIRRHYAEISGPDKHKTAIFLMVSRAKGLFMMLKDSGLNLPPGEKIAATLSIGGKAFPDFSAQVLGFDEIGLFPQHGAALALAFENGDEFDFKSPVVRMEGGVTGGVVPWLRACARRHGFGVEQQSGPGARTTIAAWSSRPRAKTARLSRTTPWRSRSLQRGANDSGTQQEQICEADFYISMFHLERAAPDEARKFVTAAAGNCPADMLEKAAAKAELARGQTEGQVTHHELRAAAELT